MSRATSLTPLDAWVLARLLVGRDVEGWLDRVSESTRPLAQALGSEPLETRSMTWQCHMDRLEGPEGPQEWTAAVAAVDPEGPAPSVAEPAQRFRLVRLADAEPQPVEWLWPDRIAIGKVTTIAGDPGLGKSFLTLWLASLLSRGGAFPDRPGESIGPGESILLSAEDDVNDTIRPRLDFAGADVTRVFALTTGAAAGGSLAPFDLTTDIPRLEEILGEKSDVRLLVIDPVSAYLGDTDENKNGQIRGLIAPLSELAARYRVAVVLVTHMNKATGLKAIYRATGSLAFVAAARTVWLVAKDPGDAGRRLFLPLKNNLAQDSTGLAYRIVDGAIRWDAEPVTMSADEALNDEGRPPARTSEAEKAADWLKEHLADGPKPSEEIVEQGNAKLGMKRGLKWWRDSVLKGRLGGQPRKSGFQGGWTWELPAEGPRGTDEASTAVILPSGESPDVSGGPEPSAGRVVSKEPEEVGPGAGPAGGDSWEASDSSPSSTVTMTPVVGEGGDR